MNFRIILEYILLGILLIIVFTSEEKLKAMVLKVVNWLLNRGKKKQPKKY